jgi:hypothetical protein
MKPHSGNLRRRYVFGALVLIVAMCASCVPTFPAEFSAVQLGRDVPQAEVRRALTADPAALFPGAQRPDAVIASEPEPAIAASAEAPESSNPLDSAFVRDVDLGNSQRQAIVSDTPVNYQAEDGSWQPIDPRFEAVPQGFVNRRNSFEIAASDQRAALRLRSGNNLIGWEAQGVALTTASGGEVLLAAPLSAEEAVTGTLSGSGRTIRYTHNWTLPEITEELTAAPGQVEQSLIFSSRPAWPGWLDRDS